MGEEDPYDRLKNLPPEIMARLKARKAQSQVEENQRIEEYARELKPRDFVYGIYSTPGGRIDPNSDVFTIAKWADDYGNTVYVKKGSKEDYPPQDQIRARSITIKTQQTAFTALYPSEQSRIRAEFASPGNRTGDKFADYLTNESLAQQFQKLKR